METNAKKNRESGKTGHLDWACVEFARLDVASSEKVAEFIASLWTSHRPGEIWDEQSWDDPDRLLETLWTWRGAPRKRMAKLCWQLLVQNKSLSYFDEQFTIDEFWLSRQVHTCERLLLPIQKKLRWVLEGFGQRRREDQLIGQGSWGEEWLLPSRQTAYVRRQLRQCSPDLVEESSCYEDSLHYFSLPYFELVSRDHDRDYVGELRQDRQANVWIRDNAGQKHPLYHATFPFSQTPGTGFSWGYCGGGPSALALSILADSTGGDVGIAERLRIPFLEEVLSKISWSGNLRIQHREVLRWLETKGVGPDQLASVERKIKDLTAAHSKALLEQKKRLKRIQQLGGLRMQRFDIIPPDFESSLYVDLMRMFERAGWVLHCDHCGQPIACERSQRGNRQRARWLAGRSIYHEWCFSEHRRKQKRAYWEKRSSELAFRLSERQRARKRRKRNL